MPQDVRYRFWMTNYAKPKYEEWDNLLSLGEDVIGSYIAMNSIRVIKEMCLMLPDKNNKLVYENDVLLVPLVYKNPDGSSFPKESLMLVTWQYAGFILKDLGLLEDIRGVYITPELLLQSKIVGTVHDLKMENKIQN